MNATAPAPKKDLTLDWRAEQFEQGGLDADRARLLAHSSVDLEEFRKLIAADCPPLIAYDIVR